MKKDLLKLLTVAAVAATLTGCGSSGCSGNGCSEAVDPTSTPIVTPTVGTVTPTPPVVTPTPPVVTPTPVVTDPPIGSPENILP